MKDKKRALRRQYKQTKTRKEKNEFHSEYKKRLKKLREKALDDLVKEAQELGLGY